jgi:hypothetical protein
MNWFLFLVAAAIGFYLFVEISWYCFLFAFRILDNYLNG